MAKKPSTNDNLHRDDQPSSAAPNPFDPASLRLSQDYGAAAAVEKVLTNVPVRKPHKQHFVRVRGGEEWSLETSILEDGIAREHYLIAANMRRCLSGETKAVCLRLATDRQGNIFFWPINLPSADGRSNPWNESAMAASKIAENFWIRVMSNQTAGVYDTLKSKTEYPEPEWPDLTMGELLKLAFQDHLIDSASHPIVRSLKGEA